MTQRFTVVKDPQAVLPYTLNWADWLVSPDVITSHAVTAGTGITKDSDSFTTTAVTAVLSGGTAGAIYEVVYHVTTAAGLQDERTLTVIVQQR